MKRLPLLLALLFGGFLLIAADGCSSDPNVEGAKLDLKNKDYDRALENITKALETNPENADAHELKGQILQEQAFAVQDTDQHTAMLSEMMDAYHRSVELDPARSANVENQLKLAYFNEFQRGIQTFNRGQQASGSERGEVFSDAAVYFGNAAMIFPDSTGAYVNQAFAYFSGGMSEQAIEPFEKAVEGGDTSEDTFVYLADLYRSTEQADKGIVLLEKARTIYPENESLQAQLMNFYVMAEREDEAIKVYQDAVNSDPNNKLYRYNFGSLLLTTEDYDGAIEQLSAAVELDSEYANAQYNLGAAYVNKAVMVNDEVNEVDDELREKKADLSEEQVKEMEMKLEALIEQRRNLFASAVAPLEKAKMLTEAEGNDLKGICQALFQSYAQTGQTEKAESVSECAGYDVN